MKLKAIAILLLFASFAHAETAATYQWVPLTKQQMKTIQDTYKAYASEQIPRTAIGALAISALAKGAISFFKEGSMIPATISSSAVLSVVAAEGYAVFQYYFSPQELMWLTLEMQSHQPGLLSEKLQQVASENGWSLNRMVAALNVLAIQNQVCGDFMLDNKKLELKRLGQEPKELKQENTVAKNSYEEQLNQIRNQLK